MSSGVFYYKEFNDHDLGDDESPLRKKFNEIIKDLEENNRTSQGDIKLIKGDGDIKYFRAKLSDSDRLLFTSIKHSERDAFVILEVISNHDYQKSKFLTNKEKIRSIKIIDQNSTEVSDTVEIEDNPQVRWLGKFITLSATQENIVKNAEDLPLIISGSAGSGKTSVALEKFRKIEEKFEEGKVLYITQSENLIKQSKELYEYVYWDEAANDFKIGIPDRIEFLSLHEFLEKRAEDIKGKKPIDRSKFFSWFNEVCKKEKFKKYTKDGDKIFEEFTAVIAGRGLTKKEEYNELGSRQAIFPEEKRDHIYGLFEEYKEFIEENLEHYDPNLIAHKCTEEKIYDAVVVDEVQDLTESTLSLILKSLRDESKGNFLLCGDVNQVIHPSFFSKSRLKSFLSGYTAGKDLSICNLKENYRNSPQVIELANRILHLKNYCFASEDKMTADEKEAFFMNSNVENTGSASFISDNEKEKITEKVSSSTNWAVLVLDDENKEKARKLLNTPLVFNIHEVKGLEYKNVVLYEFISHEAYKGVWNIAKEKTAKTKVEDAINEVRNSCEDTIKGKKDPNTSRSKDKKDKSFEEFKFYINALYVAVSRAIDGVHIIGNEKKCDLLKVIKPEKIVHVDIKKEESTPENWRSEALKLIDQGKMEQAERIKEKLKNEGKKEYAEEITKKLEAKGYHKEQAILESKTELKKSSIGDTKSRILSEKTETREIFDQRSKKKEGFSTSKKRCEQKVEPELKFSDKLKKIISKDQLGKFQEEVKQKQYNKEEILIYALGEKAFKIAKYLIEYGTDVNSKDIQGFTPLHHAAENGHDNVVKFLLDKKANVNAKTNEGFTPLHLAAQKDLVSYIKFFTSKQEDDYSTRLYSAVEKGYRDIVELLLDNEAQVDAQTKKGFTPLHCVAQKEFSGDVSDFLHKIDKGTIRAVGAAQKNLVSAVDLLLRHKANVDAQTNENFTPLHLAAQKGRTDIIELLLGKGANIDAKADGDYTPLHLAAKEGHKDVVQLLLDNGADINARDKKNFMPFDMAAQNGHYSIVEYLLQKGSMISMRSGHDTALHGAAKSGNDSVVELLLGRGFPVNVIYQGLTPLHNAAENGHYSVVKRLLQKGADVNTTNDKDNTPLASALEGGHSEVIDLLLADPNINVGCVKIASMKTRSEEDQEKFRQKFQQDYKLLKLVEKTAKEKDKLDELLKDIKDLLKQESKYGFKPSLNYSPDGSDENTTLKLVEKAAKEKDKDKLKASGKLLDLLCDYAERSIGKDTEIFKRLKQAKEKQEVPQSQLHSSAISRSGLSIG